MTEKNLGYDAGRYAQMAGFDGDWRDLWWHQDYLELLSRRWGLSGARKLLDVGCGAGHWGQRLSTLLDEGAEVTGIDHEAGFLDAARQRAERFDARFTYLEAKGETLPFPDATFDVVTCQTVLIHVADAAAVLAEMRRVAKPGGLLVAAEPDNLVNAWIMRMNRPLNDFGRMHRLLEFEAACYRGKRATGQGDGAAGERLPHLFAELGLRDTQVYKNDRCASMIPPYETPEERAQLAQMRKFRGLEVSRWGDRDTSRALFLAGGGDPDAFDALWAEHLEVDRAGWEEIDAGTYTFAGGFQMFVASGRK